MRPSRATARRLLPSKAAQPVRFVLKFEELVRLLLRLKRHLIGWYSDLAHRVFLIDRYKLSSHRKFFTTFSKFLSNLNLVDPRSEQFIDVHRAARNFQ